MSSNKKTTYYNLSQFQDADKPTWRGDYNGDMAKIDTGIRDASVKATDARTAADNAKSTADTAKTTADHAATVAAIAKTTADNAIANKADTDNVYTKTETNTLVHQRKIVVFGDSWTHLYNDSIPKTIASTIGGTLVKNYGIDGAQIGSANSSDTHYQAETAKADTAIDKEAVTDVVLLATVNNAGGAKITDDYLNYFAELRTIYPYASYWFVQNSKQSINSDAAALNDWYFPLQSLASQAGWTVATYSPLWLLDSNYLNYWNGISWTQRHPNENGCNAFANRAAAFLSGRDYKPHMVVPFTVDTGFAAKLSLAEFTINDSAFILDGFDLKVRATIVGRSNTTDLPDIGEITVGTIPQCFVTSNLEFCFPALQVASTQSWSDYHMKPAGVFRIRGNGNVNMESAAFRDNQGYITAFGCASVY